MKLISEVGHFGYRITVQMVGANLKRSLSRQVKYADEL
jgi:hypothetical protein